MNVASTYPREDLKKNCTPLTAATSLSTVGSVGLVKKSPVAVAVKVRVGSSTITVDGVKDAPEASFNGVW